MAGIIERIRNYLTEGRVVAISVFFLLITTGASIMTVWGARSGNGAFAWLLIAIVSAVLGILTFTMAPSIEALTLVRQARTMIRTGRYQNAVLNLNRAIELRPRMVDAYITRSAAYTGLSQLDLAMEDAERAVRIAPRKPDTRLARARLYSHRGLHEDAIHDVQVALREKPEWSAGYLELARLQVRVEDYEGSLAALRKVDSRHASEHTRYDALILAGQVYEKNLHNLDMAIAAFTRAIPILPDCKIGYMRRAYAYLNRGDVYQAAEDLLRAAQRPPTPEDAEQYHWLRAVCYNRRWTITGEERDFTAWMDALNHSIKEDSRLYSQQSRHWLESLVPVGTKNPGQVDLRRPPTPTIYPN